MRSKLLLLLSFLCLLAGCAGEPEARTSDPPEASAPGESLTFTDDLGREVTLERPQRAAVLLGSYAQVWQLAGGEVCAAPNDAWTDLGLELSDAMDLGGITQLSLEKLLAAQPDLVLAGTNTRQDREWQDTLEKAGIPTGYFDVSNFEGYLRLLEVCTTLTGHPERYEEYGTQVAQRLEQLRQEGRARAAENGAPRVLVLRASPSIIQAKNSTGNVLGELLADLGCENIADVDEGLMETLSLEHILAEDPDFIFIFQRGSDMEGTRNAVETMLADQPAWGQVSAVREGRVFYMDKALFSLKPNHRWAEAYEIAMGMLWDET